MLFYDADPTSVSVTVNATLPVVVLSPHQDQSSNEENKGGSGDGAISSPVQFTLLIGELLEVDKENSIF